MGENEVLAEMRVLVGFLGEEHHWWSSQFFARSAHTFLDPIFPRSLSLSQYQGVTAAAARAHDERIGVGEIVHLYRMPELHEQAAASVLRERAGADQVRAYLKSREEALDRLRALATPVHQQDGPVLIGEWEGDMAPLLWKMAGHYVAAMHEGRQAYPYVRHAK